MQETFLPTRDLGPLRRPVSLASVECSLNALVKAAGLGEEVDVVLDIDERVEVDLDGDDDDNDDDNEADADSSIEERFAQTWLTKLISLQSTEVDAVDEEKLYALQDQAGSVLAALCGSSASNLQITRFVFQSNIQNSDHDHDQPPTSVRIQDSPITSDALGNRTWGAAPLLSRHLVSMLHYKSLEIHANVLELGAGTGLVGLAVAAALRTLKQTSNRIDLTDYHPHVLQTLSSNVDLNGFKESNGVHVARLDWQAVHREINAEQHEYSSTAQTLPFDLTDSTSHAVWPVIDSHAKYQLIIAADCIYDPYHPQWIHSVTSRHLDRQDGTARLLLISPLRRTHHVEIKAIYDTFSAPSSRLRITREWQQVGYDDFAPQMGSFSRRRKTATRGLRSVYRCFEIRWICTDQ